MRTRPTRTPGDEGDRRAAGRGIDPFAGSGTISDMGDTPRTDDETASTGPLTPRELHVLEFAALRWRQLGAMESAVRRRFGWTLTRYHQVLAALTDRPEAAAHAPQLIGRLTRLREIRRRARTHGTET